MQREERARLDLEEHRRRLADEIDCEIARTQRNPWLKPWDPGYESPTLIALRQATEARGPSRVVDAGAILRRMEARLAEIRREHPSRSVPARRPVSPVGRDVSA
jgi:hypothetical protein